MGQLSDLPPELILTIFSHLRLGLPTHDLFVWTRDIDEQGRITGVRWNDLLNFSLLNRHFRQIVSDKLYTQIRIQGKLPITRLVSFLRFITAHPEAAADVRQVYINLDPGRTGSGSLRQKDIYLIQTAAENSGITYPQEIFPCEDLAADHLAKSLICKGLVGAMLQLVLPFSNENPQMRKEGFLFISAASTCPFIFDPDILSLDILSLDILSLDVLLQCRT